MTQRASDPGRSDGPCNYYNRARRRLRNRRSTTEKTMDAAVAAAMAIFSHLEEWEPPSGPYLQQVMPGWRVGPVWPEQFCGLALLTLICGGLTALGFLCWANTAEIALDYTDCANATPAVCHLSLELKTNLTAPVYMYYALRNTYFNHRKIRSWSLPQLLGLNTGNLTKACGRHAYRDKMPVLPCGGLANAIFNDTFVLYGPPDASGAKPPVPLSSEGIGWPSDTRGVLYKPLPPDRLSGTVRPANWPAPAAQRYQRPFADAEDLHAWLRTPAFSSFRKMQHCLGNLRSGSYHLVIGNNYPVIEFGGSKRLIVAQKSAFGGKNIALALLPMAAGGCYFLLCISVLIECHCRKSRQQIV